MMMEEVGGHEPDPIDTAAGPHADDVSGISDALQDAAQTYVTACE
jgi:hypothetical protein